MFSNKNFAKFNNFQILLLFLIIIFFSRYFEFDISNGGASSDFKAHWKYIKDLNLNTTIKVKLLEISDFDNGLIDEYQKFHHR